MDCPNLLSNVLVLKVLFLLLSKIILSFEEFCSGDIFEGEILALPKFFSKKLSVDKYECVVDNVIGDTLRKTISVRFRGKKFIWTAKLYQIESQAMCGAIDPINFNYFV